MCSSVRNRQTVLSESKNSTRIIFHKYGIQDYVTDFLSLTHFGWVTIATRRYSPEQSNFRSPQREICKSYTNLTDSHIFGKIVIIKQFLMPMVYVKDRI